MYENKKILILGAARSGIAVAKLLANKNNDIILSDIHDIKSEDQKALEDLGIKIIIYSFMIAMSKWLKWLALTIIFKAKIVVKH